MYQRHACNSKKARRRRSNEDDSPLPTGTPQLLLPRDAESGAAFLLVRMAENPRFQRFALPSLKDTSKSSYEVGVGAESCCVFDKAGYDYA
jgi:hypothetical protein